MAAKKSAKKKQAKQPDVAALYWDHLLTNDARPKSVYAFCKEVGMEEAQFYDQFSSFESIESRYWRSCVDDTIAVLDADDDYAHYDSQQKLLAFYFTFFAHIQRHRSRLVSFFPCMQTLMPPPLRGMRESFITWADALVLDAVNAGEFADRKKFNELYAKGLFEQLRFLIDYYRKDSSDNFQDTDALVEKSVRFFADSARSGVLDSALDLARFMLRKFQK
ncbi:hypothetical protein [Rubritalea tangerina]|uniref:Tetracyclin repressor-like C-terminal domain-containing protein n=1 Tax=Rubritalea tangerina TaxID=430798 RepID=A0ABW4ZDQ3_9BACT